MNSENENEEPNLEDQIALPGSGNNIYLPSLIIIMCACYEENWYFVSLKYLV